jgi:hypothetical protein
VSMSPAAVGTKAVPRGSLESDPEDVSPTFDMS